MVHGALKRKRGPGHTVLKAAQLSADPVRAAYVTALRTQAPNASKRLAQASLFMPKGRSGIRHLLKQPGMQEKFAHKNAMHHHDVMRKYYRGKVTNGIKSHILTYAKTAQ